MHQHLINHALNRGERNALRCFAIFSSFEPPSKHLRIGVASLRSLVLKGLAVEGAPGTFGPVFMLTTAGQREWSEIIRKNDAGGRV